MIWDRDINKMWWFDVTTLTNWEVKVWMKCSVSGRIFIFLLITLFDPIWNNFSVKTNHLCDIWRKLGHHHDYFIIIQVLIQCTIKENIGIGYQTIVTRLGQVSGRVFPIWQAWKVRVVPLLLTIQHYSCLFVVSEQGNELL